MSHSNYNLTETEISSLSREAAVNDFTASNVGVIHYAKEAVEQLRELTDMNDEQIYDEIVSYGISEREQDILADILGLN